jgi:uncharacterized protein (TIGR02147 family)
VNIPNIYDFQDYRDFLKAWFDYKKSTSDYWSYGLWARKLGLKTTSALTMVIKKDRHAGPKMVEKFISYFELGTDAENYFKELVRLNKVTKNDPKLLVMLTGNQGSSQSTKGDLVFQWLAFAIREMSHLEDFKPEWDYILSRLRPHVEIPQVQLLLEKLVQRGILTSDYKVTNKVIAPEGEVNPTEVKNYHDSIMELAKEALPISPTKRTFTSSTISIASKDIEKAQKMIRDFQVEFGKQMEAKPGDDIYLFNMQFFPLTK